MIKKQGSFYVIVSKKTPHKVLGKYKTKTEALKRLRQIEFFKHAGKSGRKRR